MSSFPRVSLIYSPLVHDSITAEYVVHLFCFLDCNLGFETNTSPSVRFEKKHKFWMQIAFFLLKY